MYNVVAGLVSLNLGCQYNSTAVAAANLCTLAAFSGLGNKTVICMYQNRNQRKSEVDRLFFAAFMWH